METKAKSDEGQDKFNYVLCIGALFSFCSLSQEVKQNSDYSYDNNVGDKPWAFDSQNYCLCYIKVKEKKTTFILCLLCSIYFSVHDYFYLFGSGPIQYFITMVKPPFDLINLSMGVVIKKKTYFIRLSRRWPLKVKGLNF